MLKAWDVTAAATNPMFIMKNVSEKQFQCEITSLQLVTPTFLVIGLANGTFSGWDLNTN